ncbi:PREDICTED: asparagine synthetase [glutamine-hydrolyzing] [Nicrophorus vespilloides]|uniref:Asparagine synthetase [glutamine-hydrolyzing] n=1 Tax=Nicrophorus vespilloides TaxID=110193 RepID=A0ABM1NCG3_NICVS|nr:PREDICTED: asparagine synthetase [glutamine-hydrolyzing] [Nicrophorus vespilloides]XP_017784514.1 PREDICTED: asparagine synthetase [glutamine-hydrolyzing] [Nicrophorus vespilloides]XP_017784515.1 PREDICTED: asparagine synthetase [glutamine-hydrolyzing] [Nicrophorus vespilloides]
MCGIWAIFGIADSISEKCSSAFKKITARGPDAWRIEYDNRLKNCCIGFHRLTIVDCTYGMQPMRLHQYPMTLLICNGELYNCKKLKEEFGFKYETNSDVECILHLYKKFGTECTKYLDGVYAFCIVDMESKKVIIARDPYGVRPMFRLRTKTGVLAICSEAKGLVPITDELNGEKKVIEPFKPGTIAEYSLSDDGKATLVMEKVFHKPGERMLKRPFIAYEDVVPNDHLVNIRKLFEMAVKKRLMADRRLGCLLSGGLDSSLTASILVKAAKEANIPYKIQTFSIGMRDSPDLVAAREVAKFIDTEHHEITFTEKDVEDVLDEVIYTLETPDITTIRASIVMYLIARYIKKNTDTTVLFSGEGADEVAQGYIYFKVAPNAEEAYKDSIRLLEEIYLFDGLRADRTISSQGLELRVPFLDVQFSEYYLSLPKEMIRPKDGKFEKYLLRSAFADQNVLPDSVLWRHKEAFSDGVTSRSKSLFQILQELVEKRRPELTFNEDSAKSVYPHCTPTSKEALYYREVFESHYPNCAESFIPYYWMPRWCEGITDPSARFITHYAAETETAKRE